MASDDQDIPQIAVVGVPEDNNLSTPTHSLSSPSPDAPRRPPSPSGHGASPTNNQGYLSLPTPILKSGRNSLEASGSPSLASDTFSIQPPPSPTLSAHSSIRFATSTVLRENNPEEHDGLSSLNLLAPPPSRHRRKGSVTTVSSVGSSSTERDVEDNQSFRLSPVRSAHSDVASTLPSPTHTHVDPASSDVSSRPSSPASFLKKTLHRVRRPSPSPTGESDTNSDTTRHDGPKGDNADVNRNGPQLARPALLDLKQEADLNVHPFAFKPLQLASLVDPKSLETLETMGGVDGLLRGLGTQANHGLSTKRGTLRSHPGSPDPASQGDSGGPPAAEKEPPKPNITITSPAGVPQGMQSVASLGGASGASIPLQSSEDVYKASIQDRQRTFGQNVIPQRPSKSLLQLMWLALQDRVLVC
jgi:Ca2+-transporting ATPase